MKALIALGASMILASCVIMPTATTGFLARHGHAAVVTGDRILVVDGSKGTDEFADFRYDNLVRDFVSSPDGITWSTVMPLGYFYGTGSAALVDGDTVVASPGASTPPGDPTNVPNNDNVIYSNATGGSPPWQVWGSLPVSLSHFGFIPFHGRFWVLGGNLGVADLNLPYSASNMRLSNAVYSIGGTETSWTEVLPNDAAAARWGPREGLAVVVFDDKLWVFGGRAMMEDPDTGNAEFRSMGDAWSSPDGIHWTFEPQTGDASRWEAQGRAFHQVVVLNGALYLSGGIDQNPKYRYDAPAVHNDIQRSFNGKYWHTVATFLEGRYDHAAVVKGGSIYLIGGRDATNVFNDVVIYTP
jgi:hypothetical protein